MIRQFFASSPLVHIKSIAHKKADEKFLEVINETVSKNIEDVESDVEKLAKIMNMSRNTLYRKIKAISDLTPIELINIARLKKLLNYLPKLQIKFMKFPIWLVSVLKAILPGISRNNLI
jgi:methylphosphotriester-DNA--protein-cysteine methyltransferase